MGERDKSLRENKESVHVQLLKSAFLNRNIGFCENWGYHITVSLELAVCRKLYARVLLPSLTVALKPGLLMRVGVSFLLFAVFFFLLVFRFLRLFRVVLVVFAAAPVAVFLFLGDFRFLEVLRLVDLLRVVRLRVVFLRVVLREVEDVRDVETEGVTSMLVSSSSSWDNMEIWYEANQLCCQNTLTQIMQTKTGFWHQLCMRICPHD